MVIRDGAEESGGMAVLSMGKAEDSKRLPQSIMKIHSRLRIYLIVKLCQKGSTPTVRVTD